jgi:hypothetical protein
MGEACFTGAVLAGLRLTGLAATRLEPAFFAVGSDRYLVNFWCTPATLTLCLLFLLGFAGQRPLAYLKTALAFTALASLLLVGNVVLSVHLNRGLGIAWTWAHRPGLTAVYVLCLGACLGFLARHQPGPAQLGAASSEAR